MNKYECKELQKLANYLTEKDIHWENASSGHLGFGYFLIERVHFYIDDELWSAICATDHGEIVTYGTKALPIELMIGEGEPEGYLKADDVIEKIERRMENGKI